MASWLCCRPALTPSVALISHPNSRWWIVYGAWEREGSINNIRFYAYAKGTTVSQSLKYFNDQSSNKGGKNNKQAGGVHGIFIWSADDSNYKKATFDYEGLSQDFLASQK
ncbi:chitinase 2-like [Salvia divinorum]|uniref:Chitinase 2-like n=1 Tax=Salvia divinorum TaxID=28513 RepID=A0ABD1GNB5_SALDI